MNIGIFTDTYFPQINGVVTSTMMLEKELKQRGHNVYIFTTSDPNVKEQVPNVYRMPSMPFVFLPSTRVALVYPPKTVLGLSKLKLDIIHTQTEFPMGIFGKVASQFLKVPQVHTYHTMYEDYVHYVAKGHLITPKMAQQFSRIFCNGARVVVAPVEKARESLLEYGVERPIRVIPTGIDFEPFSRETYSPGDILTLKKELGLDPADPVVVSVGRVAKEKSIDVILAQMPGILKQVPNAKFVIVGGGPAKEELEQMAAALGVSGSVIFTGFRPWKEIGKYYQIGDLFVSASTSETQGLTYVEAMAAKVPVCAKKDKSVEGLITHGVTGYYFNDNSDAAKEICAALMNPKSRAEVADNAFQSIQCLSSRQFADNIESLYREVAEAYPKTRQNRNIKLRISRNR